MKTLGTMKKFYGVYTVYTLFVALVSDYQPLHYLLGLLVVWLTYWSFKLGIMTSKKRTNVWMVFSRSDHRQEAPFPLSQMPYWGKKKYFLSLIAAWISAILTARFYTGRGFTAVLKGIFGGDSSYNSYQEHFAQSGLSSFSLAKIPYILMLAFLTIITVWSILAIVLGSGKIYWWKKCYLVGVVSAYMYFGIARGTNFETYIIFIMFAYCLLSKIKNLLQGKNLKYLIMVGVAGVILVFIYRARVMDRGVVFQNGICPEIHYNENSLIVKTFPTLVNIALSLFGYLGYGVYCIGVTVKDIFFQTPENILAMMFPNGFKLLIGQPLGTILKNTIDMGVKWTPDFVNLTNITGILFYFIIIYALGRFTLKIENYSGSGLLKNVLEAIIFLEMLSIPVGSFILTSSSNELMVLFAILWYVQSTKLRIWIKA